MPGLVKVGKTGKAPERRVAELSGATGVATPFVLAFQQEFPDCDLAEKVIHSELARKGLRPSPNREFFRAPADEVIRVVLTVSAALEQNEPEAPDSEFTDDDTKTREGWQDIFNEGLRTYFGRGETIADKRKGLELLKLSANLGSIFAYIFIGNHYKDIKKYEIGITYYNNGAALGDYDCYEGLGSIYYATNHPENFKKSYKRYFCELSDHITREPSFFNNTPVFFEYALSCCILYMIRCEALSLEISNIETLKLFRDGIFEEFCGDLKKESLELGIRKNSERRINWVKSNLFDPIDPTPISISEHVPNISHVTELAPAKRAWWRSLFGD